MAAANPLEPDSPDYSSDAGWLCRGPGGVLPALPQSVLDARAWPPTRAPAGLVAPTAAPGAACFWVHPTLEKGGVHSNRATTSPELCDFTLGQASAFGGAAGIWACRYRQFVGCDAERAVRRAAFALAYGDVRAAFAAFLAQIGPATPFFLAGHSQVCVVAPPPPPRFCGVVREQYSNSL
jgi:hypothetical protein